MSNPFEDFFNEAGSEFFEDDTINQRLLIIESMITELVTCLALYEQGKELEFQVRFGPLMLFAIALHHQVLARVEEMKNND